jgi:hypothetical protein
VEALTQWHARFGIPQMFISDQGSHFKNAVMTKLANSLRVHHRFTVAHSPRGNGTVEVVNRHLLKILRTLRSEWKVDKTTRLIRLVQAVLNHSPRELLGGLSPVEVFTGLPAKSPLDLVMLTGGDLDVVKVPTDRIVELSKKLMDQMDQLHRTVVDKKERNRLQRRMHANKGLSEKRFHLGDFVVVFDVLPGAKANPRYNGPWTIKKILGDHTYQLQDLLTGSLKNVHADRIMFYTGRNEKLMSELRDQVNWQQRRPKQSSRSDL